MKRMLKVLAAIDAILSLSLGGIDAETLRERVTKRCKCNADEYAHALQDLRCSGMIRVSHDQGAYRVTRAA